MESAKIKLETVILTTAVVVLSDPLFLKLFTYLKLPLWESLGFTRIAQTVLVLAVIVGIEKDFRSVGLSEKHFFIGLKQGFIWSASFGLIAAIVFGIIKLCGYNPFLIFKTRLPALIYGKVLFFIVGGLIAPFAEEVFFRGVIFGYMRNYNFPFALFMSSAIFVSFHFLFTGIPFPAFDHLKIFFYITGGLIAPPVILGFLRKWNFPIALFISSSVFIGFHILFYNARLPITQIVGGLVFAVSYEIEKSLWVPVIIHMAGNLALFSLSLF